MRKLQDGVPRTLAADRTVDRAVLSALPLVPVRVSRADRAALSTVRRRLDWFPAVVVTLKQPSLREFDRSGVRPPGEHIVHVSHDSPREGTLLWQQTPPECLPVRNLITNHEWWMN
jgi:hypothetical protein